MRPPSPDDYPDDPIRPRKAAQLLGVHISAVYRWMKKGRLSWWRLPSGHKRVSQAEVLALPKPGRIVPVQQSFARIAVLNREAAETLRKYGLLAGRN